MKQKRLNFTLIEMLTVIVILAILAAIVIPNVRDMQKEAITSMVHSNIKTLQTAVDKYAFDHNGDFPTAIDPTLDNPQVIDVEMLYPKYIKSEPDYNKVKDQKYWVDAFGSVWGATVDSPNNLIKSDRGMEFAQQVNAEGYKVYEKIDDSVTSKANHTRYKEVSSFKVNKEAERIFVDGNNGDYLVSSIDRYGLESAPSGLTYLGYQQDWFSPLIGKTGTFEFEMASKQLMYWDDFRTLQETPAGTSIEYLFSVKGEDDQFTPETNDFYSLSPSKEIKIKVVMKGSNGNMPSLHDMRIFYHFAKDSSKPKITFSRVESDNLTAVSGTNPMPSSAPNLKKNGYTTNPEKPTVITDQFVVPEKISRIENTDMYSATFPPKVSFFLIGEDNNATPISSFEEMTPGSTIQVKREYPRGMVFAGNPAVGYSNGGGTYSFNPETRQGTLIGSEEPSKEESADDLSLYETIDTQNFVASSGDGQEVNWTYAEIEDVQPEGTKIVYTYKYSNSNQLGSWTGNYDSIEDVPNSKAILLQAQLMVLKSEKDKVTPPSITKVRLLHLEGEAIGQPIDSTSTNVGSASVTVKPVSGREAIYDGNDTTYANHSAGTYYYDLTGDATNRTLRILTSATGDYRGDIQLVDENDTALYTINSVSNSRSSRFYSYSSASTTEMKLRIPEGTKRIKVTSVLNGSSGTFRIHDIRVMSDNPANLGTVTHTSTDHSILLKWTRPSVVERVLVFDGNTRVGIISADSFDHNPLLSSTSHTYRLVPIHSNGAVGLDTYYTASTLTRPITWSGLPAAAFDHSMTTYTTMTSKKSVTWDGNLAGKTVYIKAEQNGGYVGRFTFRDANNGAISTFNGITGTIGTTFGTSGLTEFALKVPANAESLEVDVSYTSSGYFRVYEIEERTPTSIALSSLTASPTDSAVTLKWTNPTSTNLLDIVVMKGSSRLIRTTTNTYTDSPLYANTSYTYNLYPVAKNYAVGEPLSITAKTKTRSSGITWSGLSASAFDHNTTTYTSLGRSLYNVTWTGDLTGKTVYMKLEENGGYVTYVYFVDSNGTKLVTTNGFGGSKTSMFGVTGVMDFALQVPSGAAKLVIDSSSSSTTTGYLRVYEVEERSGSDMNITNLRYTSAETSVTLNWSNPATTDFDKVAVYKGNAYYGMVTTGTYTQTGLYANTSHTYTLIPIAKNGFVGKPFTITAQTKSRASGVQWSGLSATSFDHDLTTYTNLGRSIYTTTWTGADLTGKTLFIKAEENGGYVSYVYFTDSNGTKLTTINGYGGSKTTMFSVTGAMQLALQVPVGATKLVFDSSSSSTTTGYFRVYEVEERFASDMNISNLRYSSTETTVTLNWSNPTNTDYDKVAVYKGNAYQGLFTTGAYTNTGLYSDTSHTYTLHPIAKNGFVGKPFTIAAQTKARPSGIKYSGLSSETFDRNLTTYTNLGASSYSLTWTGDMAGRILTITAEDSGYYYGTIKFYNSSGSLVSVTNTANNTTTTSHNINGKQTFKFSMPSTVTRIGFEATKTGSGSFRVYEVEEN